ncbi:glycerophosphodiester phosphodiesterase [Phyllobacterium brassicacearum]|uniref:Glycerophosphodiester phosphodiesterase n=1 Tax=Phyllobacterium brassicacearum TaxID=314235 RepID=A0A2P7BS69_9HYPH|nr:glycerophosphodiester phosphodiesterase family protein [Phyllobacterium brassicacearum]PSH69317.1 glycerophosphodiester phosphodiesterase [Phyllobacterium brassicacearum]TDQ34515.1 glycerophosphoryl diester phosphodiesterase [Phyllobacterium brassicacearum]
MASIDWLKSVPIAHRGLHDLNRLRWENTLSAFDAAADAGFAIECDVHLSADGKAVVFHDGQLDRLTGQAGSIDKLTAAQAANLRVGGTNDHVPTLTETLRLIGGRVPIVIELKGMPGRDDGLVKAVADDLAGYDGLAAIMSFDHHLIRLFGKDAPGIPAGLTAEGLRDEELEAHFAMLAYGIDFVSYNVHHLENRFVEFVRGKLGLPVISWTVRNFDDKLISDRHVDQITFEGFDPGAT